MVKRKPGKRKSGGILRVLLSTIGCICVYACFTFGEWRRVHDAAAGTLSQLGLNESHLSAIDGLVILEYLKQSGSQNEEAKLSQLPARSCPVAAWRQMMQHWNVQSVLEIGVCGSATSWFAMHNTSNTTCVVPTVDPALPEDWQIQHNFNEGPWQKQSTVKTLKSFDVGWAIDLLLNQPKGMENYLESLRAAAILVVAIPPELNGRNQHYWIAKLEQTYALKYNIGLTEELQQWALEIDRKTGILMTKPIDTADALANYMVSLHVFLNPVISAMQRHAHLFLEDGCYRGRLTKEHRMPGQSAILHRECGSGGSSMFTSFESKLPVAFKRRSLSRAMDDEWVSFLNQTKPDWSIPRMQLETTHIQHYTTRKRRVLNGLEVQYEWGKNTSTPLSNLAFSGELDEKQKQVDRLQTIFRLGAMLKSNKKYNESDPKGKAPIVIEIKKPIVSNESISVWETLPKMYRYGKHPLPETNIPFVDFWKYVRRRARNPDTRPEIAAKLESKNLTDILPLPVLIWPMHKLGIQTAEHHHLFDDGMKESKYLKMVTDETNFDPNLLWLAEPGKGWEWSIWCGELAKAIKIVIVQRFHAGASLRFPLHISDMTDGPGRQRCLEAESLLGQDLVTYSARSVINNRHWKHKQKWIHPGERITDPSKFLYLPTIPQFVRGQKEYRHVPLMVRTDSVKMLAQCLREKHRMFLWHPIETIDRPVDVTHLWPRTVAKKSPEVNPIYADFRLEVSGQVYSLGQKHGWSTDVGIRGGIARAGRRAVHTAYMETLLSTKIIVVTQRDTWEDHYRLFEAMITGTMILSDFMWAPPSGVEDGESLVFFRSPEELEEKLVYYLEHADERLSIARKGREIAMTRHRSWHRMEEIIFNQTLSVCPNGTSQSKCPWTIHAEY